MNWKRLLGVGGGAAAVMYFFDPRMGKTRRTQFAEQVGGMFRKVSREAEQRGRYISGRVEGLQHAVKTAGGSEEPPANDATLADKVESEIVTRLDYPKGSINVNAEEGVVYLRGQVENPDQINDIEKEVRKLAGVRDVANLLHLPGQPAPNVEEAIRASHR